MAKFNDVKDGLVRDAVIICQILHTPQGKKLMAKLEEEFNSDEIMDNDPYRTAYNLGRRDVVIYLQQMVNFGKDNADDEPI